ncbi:DUF2797 domain-containing protein [Candidatus Gracilibacteria bacterium]|nr:DUF2797 domain-containing protein [Candidatus Gracilibacteria bacterium]
MKVHLYDVRWIDETFIEFQASFENTRFAKKRIKIGDNLSLQVQEEISCAGFVRDGVWKPCLDAVIGRKKCERCRAREGRFIYTSFDGFNTDNFTVQDLAKLEGEHIVYLSLFNKELIKIGVSRIERKTLRQLEQGSHFTLFIAKTSNGTLARQIETLFRRAGIADKIRASKKKDFFCPDITKEEGQKILESLFEKHKGVLNEYTNLQNFLLPSPEFSFWENIYGTEQVSQNPKSFHTVKLEKNEGISGKVIAKKGAFLALELPEELVSIGLKDLVGHQIEFDEQPEGLYLNSAFQSALF